MYRHGHDERVGTRVVGYWIVVVTRREEVSGYLAVCGVDIRPGAGDHADLLVSVILGMSSPAHLVLESESRGHVANGVRE